MKKRVIAIIAIILAVIIAALALGLTLSKCTGGKKVVQVVMVDTDKDNDDDTDDDTNDDDDDDDDDFDDDEDDDFDPYKSDNITLDTGFTDYETHNPDDIVNSSEESELFILNANNSKEHIATSLYRGMSGAMYWGTEFMEMNVFNQAYSEEMIDKEMGRFADLGLKVLRVGLFSDYGFTGNPENPWSADTPQMLNFYKFCRAADKHGLIVAPMFAWSYPNFLYGGSQYMSEVNYMYPRELDEDGNPIIVMNWGNYFEKPNVELMNERFSSWVVTAIQGFKDHGIENVDYAFFGNEPHEDGGTATGAFVDYQVGTFSAVHEALKAAGLRDRIKMIGPNQSCVTPRAGLAVAFMSRAPQVFDIYSSHYAMLGQTSVEDNYTNCAENYDGWMDKMDDFEIRNVKEFWLDESGGNANHFIDGYEDTWIGVIYCSMYTAAINSGISGMLPWQIFDQLWPQYYGSGGEYKFGVQKGGSAPSFYESERPYPMLYALSLFTKYMSSWDDVYGLGTSYRCEVEDESSGLHITMIQRGDGEYSIAVINPTTDDKSYQINLEETLGGATLYRYRYSAGEADVSLNFEVPKADIAFTNVEKTIVDTVPGGTVAIYSTIKDINE